MRFIKHLLLGILLGGSRRHHRRPMLNGPFFRSAQYSLQIERQIEEANRWWSESGSIPKRFNKLAEQLSTMKGGIRSGRKACTS